TSSRNSEVIHAGIYYKKGSLKATTCIEGNRLLYELCATQNIPYKKTGKLIVATSQKEVESLKKLLENAKFNGVEGLLFLEPKDINRFEPSIEAKAAIYSPQSGIIDSHSLMKYLELTAKKNGVDFAYNVTVLGIEQENSSYKIRVKDSDNESFLFKSEIVINCAGLKSDIIAQMAGIDIIKNGYNLSYCKGEYFRIAPKLATKISKLIYPVPKQPSEGLGIHATPDLNGGFRLGPDHEYIDRDKAGYSVNPAKKAVFFDSVKSFLPFLEENDLSPDTAGIRPRLYKEDEPDRDFIIKEESKNGLPGFINLIGIESPGLTSTLAIASIVKDIVKDIS
ncbi:MAG: NAD(P)/FAD-dependent oxidoreductase, partial [Candidatus Omnitrophica bacterium]|nr:NAD(P)/FAD-dependent oxidoreductase [Candidatus Omnitrophota bacterium]